VNENLGRRLLDLERSLGVVAGPAAIPSMVVLLAFEGESGLAEAFADELRDHFYGQAPDLFVEVLEFSLPRPLGLKPAWAPPRAWLDYPPSAAELADLRPDLRPPTAPRADWSPPMPQDPEIKPAPPSDSPADAPGAPQEHAGSPGDPLRRALRRMASSAPESVPDEKGDADA
jgi:hypothetical protein